MSQEIVIRNRAGETRAVAVVDSNVPPGILIFKWKLHATGYAVRTPGSGGAVYMHRLIMGLVPGDGLEVDHINGNKLDNRRRNLRVVPRWFNMQNIHTKSHNKSGYRNVYFNGGRWQARTQWKGEIVIIGNFDTPAQANKAMQQWRRRQCPPSLLAID